MGKFNVTLDCFCVRPIGKLVDSTRGNPDVRATGNGAYYGLGIKTHFTTRSPAIAEGPRDAGVPVEIW